MKEMHSFTQRIGAVLAGGFLGAIVRYLVSIALQNIFGKGWPVDILLVNISGALVLAFITTLADSNESVGPIGRLFLNVGFLGAYTTFSSLALGDIQLFMNNHILLALLYLFCSLFGGIVAILLGKWLGELYLQRVRKEQVTLPAVSSPTLLVARQSEHTEHIDVEDDLLTQ